jgi:hypothetical protein
MSPTCQRHEQVTRVAVDRDQPAGPDLDLRRVDHAVVVGVGLVELEHRVPAAVGAQPVQLALQVLDRVDDRHADELVLDLDRPVDLERQLARASRVLDDRDDPRRSMIVTTSAAAVDLPHLVDVRVGLRAAGRQALRLTAAGPRLAVPRRAAAALEVLRVSSG